MSGRKKKVNGVDSSMYCLSCRQMTGTSNPQVSQTKNGKYRMSGKCSECNSAKSRFVSRQTGEGLLGKLFGAPGGKIPLLGDLPLVGALF